MSTSESKPVIAKLPHPKMRYRFLGRSGLSISAISLGGWLTHGEDVGAHASDEAAMECIKYAYDHGVNFFDSAEEYQKGRAEKLLGEAIRRFGWDRDDVVISTKLYWGRKPDGSMGINDVGLSRKHILAGMRRSLERLQMDYVDLVYAHRPDKHTPMEETVRAFNYLINSGQALYWGTSQWSAEEIVHADGIAKKLNLIGPLMEQPQYSLIEREKVEFEFARLYRNFGLGLTIFSPLGRGLLTGKYSDGIPPGSRATQPDMGWFRKQVDEKKDQLQKFGTLLPLAKKYGDDVTLAQLALAWVLKNPNVSSAIIGATSVKQLEENFKAVEVSEKLTQEDMDEIDRVMGNKPVQIPARYP